MIGQNSNKVLEEYIYILTVITLVFLMTSKFIYFNMAILILFLFILLVRLKGKIRYSKIINILIAYNLIILLQIIIKPSMFFSVEIAIKELLRNTIYILIVLITTNTKISEKHFLKLWQFIFLFTFLIAIIQFLKLYGVNEILGNIYGESIHLQVSEKYSTLDSFRAGSIFINPNSYAKFILMFLSIIFSVNLSLKIKKLNLYFLLIAIIVSLILTGSRTGIIIGILITFYVLLINRFRKRSTISLKVILAIKLLIFISLIVMLIVIKKDIINFNSFRIFQITSGFMNSINYKFKTFSNMISNFNVLNFFVGMGTFENDLKFITLIDFDIGYLITYYGSLGLILYIFMIYDFYKYKNNNYNKYKLLNKLLILVFVLFGFTGGMFFNLRFFSIYITLIYANIVQNGGNYEKHYKKDFN